MKDLPPLETLSDEEKNALIKLLWEEQQRLRAEVEKLKQKRVKKTSRNSGLPPSKGFKPNQLSQAQGSLPREGLLHVSLGSLTFLYSVLFSLIFEEVY
jgi:transposase